MIPDFINDTILLRFKLIGRLNRFFKTTSLEIKINLRRHFEQWV